MQPWEKTLLRYVLLFFVLVGLMFAEAPGAMYLVAIVAFYTPDIYRMFLRITREERGR